AAGRPATAPARRRGRRPGPRSAGRCWSRSSSPPSARWNVSHRIGVMAFYTDGGYTGQRWWRAQFILLAAIWGSSFLFIKVLGEHWTALWVAFGRVALGALALILLLLLRRELLPSDRQLWRHCAVLA